MINKRVLPIFLFVLLFLAMAWLFSDIFSYFVIALVFSAIFSPLTNHLHRLQLYGLRMPRVVAVIVSFLVIVTVISLFVLLFIPLVTDQAGIITQLDYEDLYNRASAPLQRIENLLVAYGLADNQGFLVDSLRENILDLIQRVNVQAIINGLISFTGNLFVGIIAVSFILFILLFEKGIFRRQVIKIIPNQYFEVFIAAVYKIEILLSNYLIGLLFQVFSIFCIAALGLSILGVKYALTIAVFAAVANLIPYAGPILGSTFGIAVGVSSSVLDGNTNDMVIIIVKIVAVFATVQLIDNLFLQPLIFSKSVKAHPLEIFVVIFAGATIGGVVGMIAAIPAYTIIRVVSVEFLTGYKQYRIFKTN